MKKLVLAFIILLFECTISKAQLSYVTVTDSVKGVAVNTVGNPMRLMFADASTIRTFLGAAMKGRYSGTGALLKVDFVVTHNLGFKPNYVQITPTADIVYPGWSVPSSLITSTTFTVRFASALALGASVTFDWFAYR